MTPEAASQAFIVSGYKRTVDTAAERQRIEQTRTPNFAYFQGLAPQRQVLGIDGDVGYNVAPGGNATRVSNAVARDRRAEIYHHPLTAVRAALDPALDGHRRRRAALHAHLRAGRLVRAQRGRPRHQPLRHRVLRASLAYRRRRGAGPG